MTIRTLAEVGVRLEEAVAALSGGNACPEELCDLYEMLAIQILDSEFEEYPDGSLELYLSGYLEGKRREILEK